MSTPTLTEKPSPATLPVELWIEIFAFATHVEGISEQDVCDRANMLGLYGEVSGSIKHEPALRESIISTRRHLPLVCKAWYEEGTKILYQSIRVNNRNMSSLLVGPLSSPPSMTVNGSSEPLGSLAKRVDLVMDFNNIGPDFPDREFYYDELADLIRSLHHVAIIDVSITLHRHVLAYATMDDIFTFPRSIINAVCTVGRSLKVLNMRTDRMRIEPTQTTKLLQSAPNLRLLSCCHIVVPNPGAVSSESLESLSCSSWWSVSGSPCDAFPRLRNLTLRKHGSLQDAVTDPYMKTFLKSVGPNLETLCCARGHTMRQSSVLAIARTCPRLTRIVLSVPEDALFQPDAFIFIHSLPPIKCLCFRIYKPSSSTGSSDAAQQTEALHYELIWHKLHLIVASTPSIQTVEFLAIDRRHKNGIEAVPPELADRLEFRYVYQD